MRRLILIAIAAVVFFCIGCQNPDPMSVRVVSVAETEQDVVDAWNASCITNNFGIIPEGWIENGAKNETMGNMYNGTDYSTDVHGLMLDMANELAVIVIDDPDDDDVLIGVIQDPAWY